MIINPEVKKHWMRDGSLKRNSPIHAGSAKLYRGNAGVTTIIWRDKRAPVYHTHERVRLRFLFACRPELYLKRLIIGGYERILRLLETLRNEGIDHTHQPEFTMMEWYEAYADYQRVMDVAEGLIKHLASKLYGNQRSRLASTR